MRARYHGKEGSGWREVTTDFRMWSRWNQSLEKWLSGKGQWCVEHTEKRCGQYTMALSLLVLSTNRNENTPHSRNGFQGSGGVGSKQSINWYSNCHLNLLLLWPTAVGYYKNSICGIPTISSGNFGSEEKMVSALQMSSVRPDLFCMVPDKGNNWLWLYGWTFPSRLAISLHT